MYMYVLVYNWRASVASETLTGVTQFENRGCLFVYYMYMFGRTYVILYFYLLVFLC